MYSDLVGGFIEKVKIWITKVIEQMFIRFKWFKTRFFKILTVIIIIIKNIYTGVFLQLI